MPIYTFECSRGHLTDKLVRGTEGQVISCPSCFSPAKRQSVYRVAVTGFTRTPVDQREVKIGDFMEASAEIAYNHDKAEQREGMKLPSPPLWQTAKRNAARLQKLGVRDSEDLR